MSVWDGTNDRQNVIDWDLVIERNVRLLGPIVATLCIMAGLDAGGIGARGQFTLFPQEGADDDGLALAEKSKLSPAPTLPRRVHRAVYRLLRAAEAAVRRLIVVVGRDMVAAQPVLPPPRANSGLLVTHVPVLAPGLGLACAGPDGTPCEPPAVRKLSFALLDPLPDPARPPVHIRTSGVPRISIPGWTPLFHIAPKHVSSPDDAIDAGYLRLRLEALASALGDLPRQAMRLARWRARCEALRKAGRAGRVSPLRPGRAYSLHCPGSPRREHEVDDVLRDLHYFAWEARRDTS